MPSRYEQIFDITRELKPKAVVDIGIWDGKHAKTIIEIAQEFVEDPSEIVYYAFDLFETMTKKIFKKEISKWPPSVEEVRQNLARTNATVFLFKGFTSTTLPMFIEFARNDNIKVDLILIDGGHSFETVSEDWENAHQFMGPKTIVIFDDYSLTPKKFTKGPTKVVNSIDKTKFNVEILEKVEEKIDSMLVKVSRK